MRVPLSGYMGDITGRYANFYTTERRYAVEFFELDVYKGRKYTRNLNRVLALGIAWVTDEQNREDASPSS